MSVPFQDLWFHHHITTAIGLAFLGMILGTLVGLSFESMEEIDAETEVRVNRMLKNSRQRKILTVRCYSEPFLTCQNNVRLRQGLLLFALQEAIAKAEGKGDEGSIKRLRDDRDKLDRARKAYDKGS